MGAVYEALDLRLARTVALKETLTNEEHIRRAFEHESRLLANLRHSALPKVIDHFSESTRLFLVMEFIPGPDLDQLLRVRGYPFPPHRVLEWTKHLLNALEFLHGHNPPILHRDIKPSNLKITEQEEIVLLDFGLSKGAAGQMTRGLDASIIGFTPSYASLEQIQGEGTSPQSDLYSIAATMYHLLAGQPPVDALKRAAVVLCGRSDPLQPVEYLNRHVPHEFARTLMRALELNPANRPTSAAEMRAWLSTPSKLAYEPQATISAPPPQPYVQPYSVPDVDENKTNRTPLFYVVAGIIGIILLSVSIVAIVNEINGPQASSSQKKPPAFSQSTPAPITQPKPKPTASLVPSPTPSPQDAFAQPRRSVDVIDAFASKGLEVDSAETLYPNPTSRSIALRTMKNGARFFVPSACLNCDGWIYAFSTESEVTAAMRYLVTLSENESFSWIYRKGNVVIQLSGAMPMEKAMQYRDALESLR